MPEAVARLARALETGERIAVHGDYDADGITATAILVRGLRALGAEPLWYLPHRVHDGYGLGVRAVEGLAARGARVLVAADCGITAFDAVARARALGLDVVVVDHHTPSSERPSAVIVAPGGRRGRRRSVRGGARVLSRVGAAAPPRTDPRGARRPGRARGARHRH